LPSFLLCSFFPLCAFAALREDKGFAPKRTCLT
jgi:hypothetical protein